MQSLSVDVQAPQPPGCSTHSRHQALSSTLTQLWSSDIHMSEEPKCVSVHGPAMPNQGNPFLTDAPTFMAAFED